MVLDPAADIVNQPQRSDLRFTDLLATSVLAFATETEPRTGSSRPKEGERDGGELNLSLYSRPLVVPSSTFHSWRLLVHAFLAANLLSLVLWHQLIVGCGKIVRGSFLTIGLLVFKLVKVCVELFFRNVANEV